MNNKIIGIVGGVGPYAGLDLVRKIFDQTDAKSDQEHLSIALLSIPQEIKDRTSFLLGHTSINPAYAISKIIRKLEAIGADVVGIPCNTVHVPQIFGVMVKEVARFIRENYSQIKNIGVLCTTGAYKTKLYPDILEPDFKVILPDEVIQENMVHKAVYDPIYGIKAQSDPVTEFAKKRLMEAINHLQKKGAEGIVLECTEISIAITEKK